MVQKSENWWKIKSKDGEYRICLRDCKFEGKCRVYHLCPLFNLSLHFFWSEFALSKLGVKKFFVQ